MASIKIGFLNMPWWQGFKGSQWQGGVRAGSRWPFVSAITSAPDFFRLGDYLPAPLFMQYATSYVQKEFKDATVIFRDSIAVRESYQRFTEYVYQQQFDYIITESASPCWEHDGQLIKQLLACSPKTKFVVTGPIVAARGAEILENYPVHAVIKGEYEKGTLRVLKGESGLIDFDMLTEEEMNAAPPPFMDAKHHWRYWDMNPKGQAHPHAQVWSSRGCSWRCIFCSFPSTMTGKDSDGTGKRPVRFYKPEYMESFLKEWKRLYQLRCIYDDSDTMNLGDKHTLAISEAYRKIGLPWFAMTRADTIKRETWQAMHDCGCRGVKIGFESGNQEVVDKIIRKNLNIEQAKETAIFVRKIGMTVHGTFMIGLPGETKEQQQQTIDFIKELYRVGALDTHQLSGAAALEGTPLATLEKVGNLKAYPGAAVDANYISESDGNKKMGMVAAKLK